MLTVSVRCLFYSKSVRPLRPCFVSHYVLNGNFPVLSATALRNSFLHLLAAFQSCFAFHAACTLHPFRLGTRCVRIVFCGALADWSLSCAYPRLLLGLCIHPGLCLVRTLGCCSARPKPTGLSRAYPGLLLALCIPSRPPPLFPLIRVPMPLISSRVPCTVVYGAIFSSRRTVACVTKSFELRGV